MSNSLVRINAPVGTRNGQTVMPNQPEDLATITDLFDRIPYAKGGTKEIGGLWATARPSLIKEVTVEITRFQRVNRRPTVDGVVDPSGGSLKVMNQLADDPPSSGFAAEVVPAPDGLPELVGPQGIYVADVASMAGLKQMRKTVVNTAYARRLVRVTGSSIKWYGVVVPMSGTGQTLAKVPHINFTPTPIQGGYQDASYDSFGGWGGLWRDYTSVIGGQMAASGADQVLVIPFYRTSQQRDLGNFLLNWQDVVSAVVTAAMNEINPLFLRDTYTFTEIVSSSFSNGWVAHQHFNTQAVGASDLTSVLFDLDGVAGGSNWQPSNGTIYQNRQAPRAGNPAGNIWYVGSRWNDFTAIYKTGFNSHAASRNHLLYHGLWLQCT